MNNRETITGYNEGGTMKEELSTWLRGRRGANGRPVCAYVYDLGGLRRHAASMADALPACACLFYAVKANPDPRIIQALLPHVAGFEVASAGELRTVRGVSADVPVLFGGPGKKDEELLEAIRLGVSYLHVESLLELRKLLQYANEQKRTMRILLRVNLRSEALPSTNIAMGGKPTPFGMDETHLEEAIRLVQAPDNAFVQLDGFHLHSLSNNPNAQHHAAMIELYIAKVKLWQAVYGLNIRVINAGGGFGVAYDGSPNFDWLQFTELLKQSKTVRELDETKLFFEPGRLIVADYGYYAAEVVDVKTSHGRHFAVLRGGTHHQRLPASWGHDHPFYVIPVEDWPYSFTRPGVRKESVTLVGELCTPKDRLHSDAKVERLRAGDIVVFEKSGAYSWTISHHDFLSHPHPEFHYIGGGDEVSAAVLVLATEGQEGDS
ncbi:staphyloferrin B biosynthesis decarboxylase SbnH [Paenibacillus sp. CCS19]|uniref:type III PLP-dependent enzyme n=1 Tax=Paenibacillus sp. CCS19 TaxID=3158387 RepID=UPI002569DC47|nr:type III PLP-dependent enzyme [Paenibacillus cellulosilyticus]GMK37487.1 staphyloferrin B biosynthesis decarboxylase SbnH [Paenibacillus cellulosilyticus]